MKNIRFTILWFLLLLGVNACSGTDEKNWKEEVLLQDGKAIIIDRESIYVGGGMEWASNRDLKKIHAYRIGYDKYGQKEMVVWQSRKMSPYGYPETPLVFDIKNNNKMVIYTVVDDPPACRLYSKYVYTNGSWEKWLSLKNSRQ